MTKTTEWLERKMTAPLGYFYRFQDVNSFVDPTTLEPEELGAVISS